MIVFHRPEQSAVTRSSSPSPGKPALLMAHWRERFPDLQVRGFEPVGIDDLCRVHDPAYVRGVMALELANGFGSRSAAVRDSLPYTSGSMVAAALHALREGGIAMSPTSGFHHVGYDHGGGFCTFNGLMLAALAALDAGAKRVAIVDCDVHYGDGTEHILQRLDLGDRVAHWTLGAFDRRLRSRFLQEFEAMVDRIDADVVLYQAGADAHEDDPLGGWQTTAEMIGRDRILFGTLAARSIPVAWNLAGGYQEPIGKVLALHTNTMVEALAAEARYVERAV
jgi:acetoin utilization deacetylase AcuC-like enzyme